MELNLFLNQSVLITTNIFTNVNYFIESVYLLFKNEIHDILTVFGLI